MSARYEWAPFNRADIVSSDELRELTDDTHDLHGDVVGVTVDTGSDGIMLYGPRDRAIAWAEDLLARLRAGEGAEVVDAEEIDDEELGLRSPQAQREIRAALREIAGGEA